MNIQSGSTETIVAIMVKDGQKQSGLVNVILTIRRMLDNAFLDFADNQFKTFGWLEREHIMEEVGATANYQYAFHQDAGEYVCEIDCASADNVPQMGQIIVGGFIDNVDAKISRGALETTAQTIKGKTDQLQFDTVGVVSSIPAGVIDKLNRVLGLSHENFRMKDMTYSGLGKLLTANVSTYGSKADAESDSNPIAEYRVEATYYSDGTLQSFVQKLV